MASIPLPTITDVHRCAFTWLLTGTGMSAVNVMHFHSHSPAVAPSTLMATLQASVTAGMWNTAYFQATIQNVKITPLDGVSASQTFNTGGGAKWSGTFASGEVIPAVAAVVSLYSSSRGRNNRGRIFIPFTAEGASAQGAIASGLQAPMQTAWDTFRGAVQTATAPFDLVVAAYDRKHLGAGAHMSLVTASTVQTFFGTVRKRQSRLRFP